MKLSPVLESSGLFKPTNKVAQSDRSNDVTVPVWAHLGREKQQPIPVSRGALAMEAERQAGELVGGMQQFYFKKLAF